MYQTRGSEQMRMSMKRAMTVLIAGVIAAGLVVACASEDDGQTAELQAIVEQLEEQLTTAQGQLETRLDALEAGGGTGAPSRAGATLKVDPAIFMFPEGRLSGRGNVWFYGSGLEPGQWFEITVENDGDGGPIPALGDENTLRQADSDGAFAITLMEIDAREIRWGVLLDEVLQEGGVFILNLMDSDTDAILASTPWVVCGQDRANDWCSAARATAIQPPPLDEVLAEFLVPETGTVYELEEIRIQQDNYRLLMGDTEAWGYSGRILGDVELIVNPGDKITFLNIQNRSEKPARWVNQELGINVGPLDINRGMLENFVIKIPNDVLGSFVVDDPDRLGERSQFVITVVEK